jgi:hypothetical protein
VRGFGREPVLRVRGQGLESRASPVVVFRRRRRPGVGTWGEKDAGDVFSFFLITCIEWDVPYIGRVALNRIIVQFSKKSSAVLINGHDKLYLTVPDGTTVPCQSP